MLPIVDCAEIAIGSRYRTGTDKVCFRKGQNVMDRQIVIAISLLVAVVGGGVALFALNTPSKERQTRSNPIDALPAELVGFRPDTETGGRTRVGLDSVRASMSQDWAESRATGRTAQVTGDDRGYFNIDSRPRRSLYVPNVSFEVYQPDPERFFLGRLDLKRNETRLSFPIIANRESGIVLINARGKWYEFSYWVISKQGVHL